MNAAQIEKIEKRVAQYKYELVNIRCPSCTGRKEGCWCEACACSGQISIKTVKNHRPGDRLRLWGVDYVVVSRKLDGRWILQSPVIWGPVWVRKYKLGKDGQQASIAFEDDFIPDGFQSMSVGEKCVQVINPNKLPVDDGSLILRGGHAKHGAPDLDICPDCEREGKEREYTGFAKCDTCFKELMDEYHNRL